jgi:large subunit ribosomal protein L6
MSKIGRRPIALDGVLVEIRGQEVHYKGVKNSGVHILPASLKAECNNNQLTLGLEKKDKYIKREANALWGLHRALLANEIFGARQEFEKQLEIVGLGYKAALLGTKITFSLGYSHKIEFTLPQGVRLSIDKTGKILTFSSCDKHLVGHVCSMVRSLRPPEPYKGTGVKLMMEQIIRKAGKAKASA